MARMGRLWQSRHQCKPRNLEVFSKTDVLNLPLIEGSNGRLSPEKLWFIDKSALN